MKTTTNTTPWNFRMGFSWLILFLSGISLKAQIYEDWSRETDPLITLTHKTNFGSYWVTLGSNCGSIEVVDSPTRQGERALKHTVACSSSKRAELSDATQVPKDRPLWYGWSLRPEGDWGNTSQFVGQWRIANLKDEGYPNRRCVTSDVCGNQGQQTGSGWHMMIENGRWRLSIARQMEDCPDCAGTDYVRYDLGPVAFNKWTDFVMTVKYSGSEDGHCTLWMQVDGGGYVEVVDFVGRTWYNKFQDGSINEGKDTNAANMTIGLYWSNNADEHVMYSDELRQAIEQPGVDGFELVRPDQDVVEEVTWAGFPVSSAGDVDTSDWMGYLNVQSAPWLWSYSLSKYLYLEEDWVTGAGSWLYAMN